MMKVLGDRVLVLLPPVRETQDDETGFTYQGELRPSGIILAKPADTYSEEVATRGIVVQLGERDRRVDLDEVLEVFGPGGSVDRIALTEPDPQFADILRQHGPLLASIPQLEDELNRMAPAAFDVAIGDCVLFPPSVGEQLDIEQYSYKILRESDLIGVLEPTGKEAVWLAHLAATIQSAQERIAS